MNQQNQHNLDINALPDSVEVLEPVKPAIETVKQVLFRPFDPAKWFTIGFCAWLAMLGRANLQVSSYDFDFKVSGHSIPEMPAWPVNNIPMTILMSAVFFIIFIAVTILVLWLSSRGWFMFLYCTANNKSQVAHPWKVFRSHANSLFVFRLILAVISFVVTIILVGSMSIPIFMLHRAGSAFTGMGILLIILACVILLVIMIIFAVIMKFTTDFIVPVMYLRNCTCMDAWKELSCLLSRYKTGFLLYILFQFLISVAIAAIIFASVVLPCCCSACLFSIPYIGTVVLLPVLMFKMAYGLHFLKQFGPFYNVFPPLQPDAE